MNTTDTKHLFERFAAHKAKHATCIPYNAVNVPGISDESGTLNALKESDMPKSSERTDSASKSESKSETVSILARLSGVKQNDAENDAGESVRQIAESRGISGICEDSHFDLRRTSESVPAAASESEYESSCSENASAERKKRDRLRLHITTGQAALAITVLVAALCACIAMLISQSQNMNRLTAGMAWKSVSGTEKSSSGTPSGNSQSGNSQSASPQSLSSSAQTETDESGFESESENKSSSQSSSQIPSEHSEQYSSSKLININKATSEQLQTLDGIGPSTAEKIISYRKSHGAFSSVDDLIEIPGIGAKTVEKLRNAVTVK